MINQAPFSFWPSSLYQKRFWQALILRLCIAYIPIIGFTSPQAYASDSLLCSRTIARLEKDSHLPQGLLAAIALVESGRFDSQSGQTLPWPWTVRARGHGHYFRNRQQAIHAVHQLRKQGVSNIDVGCMQINLHYHPQAFASIAEATNPAKNVAYAIQFLHRLKQRHTSWQEAIAHYHSNTPRHAIPYRRKVLAAWHDLRSSSSQSRLQIASQSPSQTHQAWHKQETMAQRRERLSRFAANARKRIDLGLKARRKAHEALLILHRNRFKNVTSKR